MARGFIPYSFTLSSLAARILLLFLLLLLRLGLFVGLRRAADHSYQHNYKLGCRLSVSLTSLHPSRHNTRSLSRPGETFVFVFFFILHLSFISFSSLLLLYVPSGPGFFPLCLVCLVNSANSVQCFQVLNKYTPILTNDKEKINS